MDHLQGRAELIGNKIHTGCVQGVQLVVGGAAELLSSQENLQFIDGDIAALWRSIRKKNLIRIKRFS